MTDQHIPEVNELLLPNEFAKRKKKMKVCIGVSFCCAATFLALSIVLPFFTTWLIHLQAEKEQILAPENQFLWTHIPGSTNTHIIRKFTFFNFTNPREVLYLNHRPLLREIKGYAFYELQDYLNIKYQGDELKFDFWLHFEEMDISRDPDQKVNIINFVPLGLWYTAKNTDLPIFCQQALALLSFNIRDSLKQIIIAQAVSKQFLPDYKTFSFTTSKSDLTAKQTQILWSDPNYGLNNPDHYQMWVNAANNRSVDDYKILAQYFDVRSIPMNALLDNIMMWAKGLEGVVDNWYCGDSKEEDCTNDRLTFMQLSQSAITARPPPGVDPTDTFCSLNITCNGYPEIFAYLKYVFPNEYPNCTDMFNLTFTPQLLGKWFFPSKQRYCILHSGNMGYLWEQGRLFDNTKDEQYLWNLQDRFAIDTRNHTFVFWSWIKYMTIEFALQNKSKNGTVEQLGVGGAIANSFMTNFIPATDWLISFLITTKVSYKILHTFNTCQLFLSDVIQNITELQLSLICQPVNLSNHSTLQTLVNVCEFEFMDDWVKFKNLTKLTDMQMLQLCDAESVSVKSLTDEAYAELDRQYGCRLGGKCTGYELVLKQWNNSIVTLNPPKQLSFPASLTLNTWNSDIAAFEYVFYLDFMKIESTFRPTFEQLVRLFSWDYLLSALKNQELMLENDPVEFTRKFYWDDMKMLKTYLKYISIEVSFGGLTVQRSVRDILFGYDDDFIRQLKELDPAMGGDPSLSTIVGLNEPNITEQQAKLYPQSIYTGKSDIKKLRSYKSINGLPYVNLNYSYFDGNDIHQAVKSPWAENDPLCGTDGSRGAPHMQPDKEKNDYKIYIPAIYRIGKAQYNTTFQMYGLDVYDMRISPQTLMSSREFPENKKYYMGFTGFINITTISFAPFFVSKNHFYDCPSNWSTFIDIIDQSGENYQNASFYDDCFIYSEPITGISFTATIYLQTNYLYESDFLFERPGMMMIPIFSLWRSANVSQDVIDEYFGLVRVGLGVVHNALWVGLVVMALFLALGGWLVLKYKRILKEEKGEEGMTASEIRNQEKKKEELMISLQPQGHLQSQSTIKGSDAGAIQAESQVP